MSSSMFRKKSRANARHHRAQWKATPPRLAPCPACGERKPPHYACPACGQYRGRQVLPPTRD
jgi:large subunit ribosomal protein L32